MYVAVALCVRIVYRSDAKMPISDNEVSLVPHEHCLVCTPYLWPEIGYYPPGSHHPTPYFIIRW